MFCSKCGNKLTEGAAFCPSCGAPTGVTQVTPVTAQPIYYMPYKKPGNGLSIAGMVLGIIAAVYSFSAIIVACTTEYAVRVSYGRVYYRNDLVAYAIGLTVFQTILALIGLPLSIAGMTKCKSGKNIAGIILNSITLLISLIIFFCVVSIN